MNGTVKKGEPKMTAIANMRGKEVGSRNAEVGMTGIRKWECGSRKRKKVEKKEGGKVGRGDGSIADFGL